MTKTQAFGSSMLVGEKTNTGYPRPNMSGTTQPDSASYRGADQKPRRSSLVRKPELETCSSTVEHVVIEPEYYMTNYEATVTVHKSPPLARRPFYDFLEIDDETRDSPQFGLHRRKHKKNLKVSFSDHIEVDIISLIEDSDSDNDASEDVPVDFVDSSYDGNSDSNSASPEPSRSSPLDKHCGKLPRQNFPQPRKIDGNTDLASGRLTQSSKHGGDAKSSFRTQAVSQSQPLLQRRKQVPKPLVSDVVHQKIVALNNPSPSSSAKRFSRSVFPDIVSTLKTEDKFKQFMTGVKRAVDNSRSYERPWLINNPSASYQQNVRIQRQKSNSVADVRRTSSLPKNFKLPENLPSPSRSAKNSFDSPRSIKNQ